MNILLVYPEMPDTFWAMKHFLKITGKKSFYPPLGLLTVAAMLPETWEKRLVDLNVQPLTQQHLNWADYVFLGAMNVQDASAREIISRCNAAGVKVVAGGPLFTHEHGRFQGVDHFVLNEAEITLPQFLSDLADGCPKSIYQSSDFSNVHETPVPLWELAQLDAYQFAIVQYSRGCPYQCDFCDVTALFGRRPRTKTPAQIITELNVIVDSGQFDSILFADDNLIGNKKQLKEALLPALIEWRLQRNPPVTFSTQVTVNIADDPELMQLMLEAGFRHLFIGIETPEEDSLIACKKRQNTKRDLIENITLLHKSGFFVVAGFIVGFDTDLPDIFERQTGFIQESGMVLSTVNMLKAPPGTELHERMKQEGRLIRAFSFEEFETNFTPAMGLETLQQGFHKVLSNVYSAKFAAQRARKFLQVYNKYPDVANEVPTPNRLKDLGIVFRSFYYIGLKAKMRSEYWKLILWTLFNRPRLIDWALLKGMMIYHLNSLYESFPKPNGTHKIGDAQEIIHKPAEFALEEK